MNTNDRLIKAKQEWARKKRGVEAQEYSPGEDERLPPGQHLVDNWPVLATGYKPEISLSEWTLTIGGFVTTPLSWTWNDFTAQPALETVSDFHCVTSWTRLDNEWKGVSFKRIVELVKPLSLAKFVLFKSYDDYTTNVPLDVCNDDDVLLASHWNGKPLTRDHGGPVRLIIPKLYAWKGAKWVKEITFSDRDIKGFWEIRGYSNTAKPWENDRYG